MAGVKGRSGMNPNSKKNLTPPSENMTHEEMVENCRKAGIASGRARRRKREMRVIIDDFLSMPMKADKDLDDAEAYDTAQKMNLTVADVVMMAQVKKAMKGDTKAAEFLRDTVGQKPTDRREITAKVGIDPLEGIMKQLTETNEEKEEPKEDK